MLRSLAVAVSVFVLAACGSSNSGMSSTPPMGTLSGTMFGQAFTPMDGRAITPSSSSCSLGAVTASATGIAVRFSTFPDLCTLMTQTRTCGSRANTTVITLVIVSAKRGGTAPPIQPGTYPVTASIPSPDMQGNFLVAQGFAVKTGDCTTKPSASFATSGTITITTVGASVSGTADLTLSDGGHVAGSFDAPTCGVDVDVCTLLKGLAENCVGQSCTP